jgi:hypothetical protein
MLPFPHIPDPVLFGSSGYPLRIEAGLDPQLNTSVNGRSTIFTANKVGWSKDFMMNERAAETSN